MLFLTLWPLSELSLFIFVEFLNSKDINGQWMGVRVTSQGPGQNVMVSEKHSTVEEKNQNRINQSTDLIV